MAKRLLRIVWLACAAAALAGCGGPDRSVAGVLDRVSTAAGGTAEQLVTASAPGADGSVAVADTEATVPADATSSVSGVVADGARSLLAPHFDGLDGAEALRVLRVACFARTLTASAGQPDIATAIDQAVTSIQGDDAFKGRVAPLATQLDGAAAAPDWQTRLTVAAICQAAPGAELDVAAAAVTSPPS